MKHLVVTPYKNEEEFIQKTLLSVIHQTDKPDLWILVNDHSEDKSFEIIELYAKENDWILNIHSGIEKQERKEGSKIVSLVLEGLNKTDIHEFDIFTKLDADITFDENYFQKIKDKFQKNNKLALCGGRVLSKIKDEFIDEKRASYHIRGANKTYSVKAMLESNCLRAVMGWDGLDEMILMYHGYEVRLIETSVYQQRMTRERVNALSFYFKNGYGKYKLGHSFPLVLVRSLKRMFEKPYFLCGFSYLCGHFWALLKREELIIEKDLAKFINKFHYRRLLLFKK